MIHDVPYGWRVTYLRHARAGAGATEATYGAKGTQTNARIRAVHKMGFIRVVKMEPLTQLEYDREFGEATSPFDRRKPSITPLLQHSNSASSSHAH